jgi:hypothetical protein
VEQRLTLMLFHPIVSSAIGLENALLPGGKRIYPSNSKEWIDNLSPKELMLIVSGKDSSEMPFKKELITS